MICIASKNNQHNRIFEDEQQHMSSMDAGNKNQQHVGERVVEEEDDEVELGLKHAGRKIWLIKVPQFVAKEWRNVMDGGGDSEPSNPVLGSLTIESGGSSAITLRLDESFTPTAHVPQTYEMMLQQQQQQMIVAFRDHGAQRSVDGIVQHRLDINPASLRGAGSKEQYSKLSRERFGDKSSRGATEKKRTIKIMQDSKIVDIRKPVGVSVEQAFGKRKKKGSDTLLLEKRVAMDSNELMALLFRLFQRQSRWSFSQLQKETDQPTQHLKKTLQEIAKQNKTGPYKDLWELSKESTVHV